MFDHEKLDAYQRAVEFLDLVDRILETTPKGRAHLKDQLDRAATSIVLNIAEGAGEFSPRDAPDSPGDRGVDDSPTAPDRS